MGDMFNTHLGKGKATVKSAAVGGTRACQWSAEKHGQQMVLKAKSLFPKLKDGPDYVWYTLGGNDVWADDTLQSCLKTARGKDISLGHKCVDEFNTRIIA